MIRSRVGAIFAIVHLRRLARLMLLGWSETLLRLGRGLRA